MALDVKVTIDKAKTVGNIGFGCPLILVENAVTNIAYATYSDILAAEEKYSEETGAYKAAQLMFMQEHKPEKIAICATTGDAVTWLGEDSNMSKDWRRLIVVPGDNASQASAFDEIGAVIESAPYKKMYFCGLGHGAIEGVNYASKFETISSFERTVIVANGLNGGFTAAALVGEISGLQAGSYTVNNLMLKGIEPLEMSKTEVDSFHEKGAIVFVLSAGDGVCSEGFAVNGSYIDYVDGNDYIEQQLEYRTQKVFNNNLKVPYTNKGIAMLETAAISVMQDAQNKGIVENYTVSYALREHTTAEDRSARKYFGGSVSYSCQGAIHNIEIYAEATV